jgi:hypothetical protein
VNDFVVGLYQATQSGADFQVGAGVGVEGSRVGWAAEVDARWGTGVEVGLLIPQPEEGGNSVGVDGGAVGAWYGIKEAISFILEVLYHVRSVCTREELVDEGSAEATHDGTPLDWGGTKQVGEGERAAYGRGVGLRSAAGRDGRSVKAAFPPMAADPVDAVSQLDLGESERGVLEMAGSVPDA